MWLGSRGLLGRRPGEGRRHEPAALRLCALWRRRHLFRIYSRPRARRSVRCTHGAGGTPDRAAGDLRLCSSGCTRSTSTAEHATSMGRRSYIKAARLEAQPLNSNGKSQVIDLRITFDGTPVKVPAYVGIDRVRALQAAVHTHDSSGQVWLEGRETDAVTPHSSLLFGCAVRWSLPRTGLRTPRGQGRRDSQHRSTRGASCGESQNRHRGNVLVTLQCKVRGGTGSSVRIRHGRATV